jgi:hypothetical protein
MINNIIEEAGKHSDIIESKIKVGAIIIGIPKKNYETETETVEDVKSNKIIYVTYKGKRCEVLKESKDKEKWYIKLEEKEPGSTTTSLPFFVLPPELEAIYGKRATAIKIMFLGDIIRKEIAEKDKPTKIDYDVNEIIPNSFKKYTFGGIDCYGNGNNDARRYDKDTNKYIEFNECPCAFNKNYKRLTGIEIENSALFNKTIPHRTIEYIPDRSRPDDKAEKKQLLWQGAWRTKKSYNKDTNIVEFEELEQSCNVLYSLRFVCPAVEGINLYAIEGKSYDNLISLIRSIIQLFNSFHTVGSIPLFLKVRMEERKSKNSVKKIFPFVYLHLPYSIDKLIEKNIQKTLLLDEKKEDEQSPVIIETEIIEENDIDQP